MNTVSDYSDYNKSYLERKFFNDAQDSSLSDANRLKLYFKVLILNKYNQEAIINARTICQGLSQSDVNSARTDAQNEIINNIC